MGRVSRHSIAIVGLSCRFPGGGASPEEYWDLLAAGRDAVSEVPKERWDRSVFHHPDPAKAGRAYTFKAGTLGDISGFDAAFFGISPREAQQMDPQQRLLLELAWEALERGGQVPSRLAGTPAAVYVGISSTEYANIRQGDPAGANAYFMLGATLSIAANRISYLFDLRGPSMAIDTACSSALVALHEAVQAIRQGHASVAVVGAVNLLLSPLPFIGFSKASMLSPYGRCRAFDGAAGGYVRAEGGGVVVLKPLADAERDGDEIFAVIRGTGINTDGRTMGIALPSSEMQEALLRQVYKEARVSPRNIAYFEAHGTGTKAGDAAEAGSIGRALAMRRPKSAPLVIGSAKSNIGHLEPAAGMAGMIKAIGVLRRGVIPPSIHVSTPNPEIDFEHLNLSLATAPKLLPKSDKPLTVGVNSFGFGGTNAHVILEEYRRSASKGRKSRRGATRGGRPAPLLLSARSRPALEAMAARYAGYVGQAKHQDYPDIAATAALRREHHSHRLVARGSSIKDLAGQLRGFGRDGTSGALTIEETLGSHPKVAFVFSGNGSQWAGMGQELLGQDAVFKRKLEEVDGLIGDRTGWSVIDELWASEDKSRLVDTRYAQPLLFALQVALAESLGHRGLLPDAVAGHSVGEVAAAHVSGALGLEQAVEVIVSRSIVQEKTRGMGMMAATDLDVESAREAIRPYGGAVEIAAINCPGAVTLSGPQEALSELGRELSEKEVPYRLLGLDYAFHNQVLDPHREDLLQRLAGLEVGATDFPFFSAVHGRVVAGPDLDARYWWDNVRQPVVFQQAISALAAEGFGIFVEIGPQPILQAYIRRTLRELDTAGTPVTTLSRSVGGVGAVERPVDRVHALGGNIDLGRTFDAPERIADLPAYPWQREPYWFEPTSEAEGWIFRRSSGPLLGCRLRNDRADWEAFFDTALQPILADHCVGGGPVLPAAGFVEMALEAGRALHGDTSLDLRDFEIRRPMVLEATDSRSVGFRYEPDDASFRIESRRRLSDETPSIHALGRLERLPADGPAPLSDDPARWTDAQAILPEVVYEIASRLGLDYGPAFRTLEEIAATERSARVTLRPPKSSLESDGSKTDDYVLHPALLDGCLQGVFAIMAVGSGPEPAAGSAAYLPQRLERLVLHAGGRAPRYCIIELARRTPQALIASFDLLDEAGEIIAQLRGFRFQRLPLPVRQERDVMMLDFAIVPRAARGQVAAVAQLAPEDTATPLSGPASHSGSDEDGLEQDLDRLAAAYARRALSEVEVEEFITAADPGEAPGESATDIERMALFLRCSELAEDAALSPRAMTGPSPAAVDDPGAMWRHLLAKRPAALAELTVLGRAGERLGKRLRGNAEEPLQPGPATIEHLHSAAPSARPAVDAITGTIESLLSRMPPYRALRILEIGAGAPLTRCLQARLPRQRVSYRLAEIAGGEAGPVTAEVAPHPFLDTVPLDLSQLHDGSEDWGLADFDLVIGVQGLHSAPLSKDELTCLSRLLAPGGLLLLAALRPARWLDVAFGDRASWWRLADDGASYEARLPDSANAWQSRLSEAGLEQALVRPAAGFFLMSARAPVSEGRAPVPRERLVVLIGADDGATAPAMLDGKLAARLGAHGVSVLRVHLGQTRRGKDAAHLYLDGDGEAAWAPLWQALSGEQRPIDLVYLHALEFQDDNAMAAVERRCLPALELLRGLAKGLAPRQAALIFVTAGAYDLPDALAEGPYRLQAAQAALVGLARVHQNENPEVKTRVIDLHAPGANLGRLDAVLVEEILEPDGEDEVILGEDRRFGLRLKRLDGRHDAARPAQDDAHMALTFAAGSLEKLRWAEAPRHAPCDDQVEIAVEAASLNFRDVMFAMGMLPHEALEDGYAGTTLGMEAAGVITRIGEKVTDFKAGDRVFCFAPACFAEHTLTSQRSVKPVPAGLSFAEAATIPAVFLTVYYALAKLARLAPGERVLIHGAAGGVGLAAIQFAHHVGAEVYATAGSDEKRDVVRLMGVAQDHIFDSRSTAFADQVMTATAGEGVDVVVNSLAGTAIRKSLDCLRPFGRFIELGKRDFYLDSKLGLRPMRNNISYFGVDADQLMKQRPDLADELFDEVAQLFHDGVLSPLPHRTFRRDEIVEAFRAMQQSRHIGKIVVEVPTAKPPTRESPEGAQVARDGVSVSADARYVITGGLSGFGLATAAWLADEGAKHLELISRRGQAEGTDAETLEALRGKGVEVTCHACDVTDRRRVEQILQRAHRRGPPIRGIIHAATLFADKTLANLDTESFLRVLAPKIAGAEALEAASRGLPLDFFVLYSSVTTLIGNPGQANYVAANAYLEALARQRWAQGLPALAVCWGAIGDTGYLARESEVLEMLESRLGIAPMPAKMALEHLGGLLRSSAGPVVYLSALDRRKLAGRLPILKSAKFSDFFAGQVADDAARHHVDFLAMIDGLEPGEVKALIHELLIEEVAKVLRMPPERLDTKKSLFDLGMDSLMAMELSMGIEELIGVKLPALAAADDTSLAALAERIHGYVAGRDGDATAEAGAETAAILSRHAANDETEGLHALVEELAMENAPETATARKIIT
jgi:acyl transferase domain-containing protein/NADPH:quinone reductase-like Zn-dependent oxidoreductase/short-subunit dehydrogenase/acyl carrier protein